MRSSTLLRTLPLSALALTVSIDCARAADAVERSVEALARQHAAAPLSADALDCRWVTQTITYQRVSQTRRVRVCQNKAWWDDFARKAKRAATR